MDLSAPETHPHRPPPEAVDERASTAGLRAVATFEAIKGGAVLLLGLGLLALLHKDVEAAAEQLLVHLHINPDRRLSHALLNAASRVTDARLWGIAGGAVAYASVRFTEAWGLWHRRVWAEWFALLSGTLYLPWEIVKLVERANLLHITLFAGNLVVILYMLRIRLQACRPAPPDGYPEETGTS
jgi:uncharacterized membrane protein (DUF2068 family)